MLIHGQEFDFSLLNANDLDRLEDALDEMTREGEAETARCERGYVRAWATVSAHRPAFPCAASTRSWAQGHPPVWG